MKLSEKIKRLPKRIEGQLLTVLPVVREAVRVNLPIGPTGDLRNSVKTTGVITTPQGIKATVFIDETVGDVREYAEGLIAIPQNHTGSPGKEFTESFFDHGSAGTRKQRYSQGYNKLMKLGSGFRNFDILTVGESIKTKRKEILAVIRKVLPGAGFR